MTIFHVAPSRFVNERHEKCGQYGRLTNPRGSRGGKLRVAHAILYAGVVHVTRALVHKAFVGDMYGDANAWANGR